MKPPPLILNPWVAFIGTLSGIIGIPLSVILFFYALKAPGLTYTVYPIKTTVLQSRLAAGLRVLHNNEEIKGDVTAVQIAIWNNGREAIVQENILTPVKIVTRPAVQILEATIRTQSRKEIEFSLDNRLLKEGVVPVSWRILEQSDGATVQLIYAGPVETKIDLEGAVVGQRTIAATYSPYAPVPRGPTQLTKVTWSVGLIGIWAGLGAIIWLVRSISPKTWWGKIIAGCILMGWGCLAVLVAYTWFSSSEPPFGF
jgi:hypothetical protein